MKRLVIKDKHQTYLLRLHAEKRDLKRRKKRIDIYLTLFKYFRALLLIGCMLGIVFVNNLGILILLIVITYVLTRLYMSPFERERDQILKALSSTNETIYNEYRLK
jgi:uncharacterized membrane protein (DUF485 family)